MHLAGGGAVSGLFEGGFRFAKREAVGNDRPHIDPARRDEPGGNGEFIMKTLRAAVEDAIRELPGDVQMGVLALIDRADGPELMTDIVSQQFVHDADLRQQLLEMDSAGERIPLLCDYLRKVSKS